MKLQARALAFALSIAFVSSTSYADERAAGHEVAAISCKLDLIVNQLRTIEKHLRRIELQFPQDSNIQAVELPVEAIVIWDVHPGQMVLPGQVLGRIVPVRNLPTISPVELLRSMEPDVE